MKMGRLEKKFVNSKKHGEKNLKIVKEFLEKKDIKAIKTGLEIGCGVGVVSAYLATTYKWQISGIDIDPEQITLAEKHQTKQEKLIFKEADATQLPFADQEFDLIISIYVIHHISNWTKAITEISRVAKNNCYFLLYDLTYSKFTTKIFKPFSRYFGLYTVDDIINEHKKNNWEIVSKEKKKGCILRNYCLTFQIHK